jgi:hypothetical protein
MEQNLFSKYKNNYTKVRLELINDINFLTINGAKFIFQI